MRERGFTLVELLAVIAIMGILTAIALMQFNRYTTKANIEKQVRTMYADLMDAKSQAIMQKRTPTVVVDSAGYSIYGSTDTSVAPILQKSFSYPVTMSAADHVIISSTGITDVDDTITYCAGTAGNPAAIDSVVVTKSMIYMGKWSGGDCNSANVTAK